MVRARSSGEPLDKWATKLQVDMMKPPYLPGLPTMAALMLCTILVAWLGLWGPIDLSKLEKWQTLIGAAVTALGVSVTGSIAIRNVSRQLRIGIVGREEDRIEKVLPGLRETVGYIQDLRKRMRTLSPHIVIATIHRFNNFDPKRDQLDVRLKNMIPSADAETRQRLLLALETILFHAERANADQDRFLTITNSPQHRRELESDMIGEARQQAKAAQTGLNFKMLALDAAVKKLKGFESELLQKVDVFEVRGPRFRREIERYFDD
jgi:hypothetical protein